MEPADKRLPLRQGLEAAQREATARNADRALPAAYVTASEAAATGPAPATTAPKPDQRVVRDVVLGGTVRETFVHLDAPAPDPWRYQPAPQTRRASSPPSR